jgi:hypothetical protein
MIVSWALGLAQKGGMGGCVQDGRGVQEWWVVERGRGRAGRRGQQAGGEGGGFSPARFSPARIPTMPKPPRLAQHDSLTPRPGRWVESVFGGEAVWPQSATTGVFDCSLLDLICSSGHGRSFHIYIYIYGFFMPKPRTRVDSRRPNFISTGHMHRGAPPPMHGPTSASPHAQAFPAGSPHFIS